MEFIPYAKKAKHLDFSRPTFNEPIIQLPPEKSSHSRLPSSFADDEFSLHEEVDEDSAFLNEKTTENVNVFLRIRPVSKLNECKLYKFDENKVIVPQNPNSYTCNEKQYSFTSIFNENINQVQIYNEIVRPVILDAFSIRGSTFTSYGVSSSGKTHTILGDSSAGLVPRAISQIFTQYEPVIAPFPCVKIFNDHISVLNDPGVENEMEASFEYLKESRKINKGKPLRPWSQDDIKSQHNFEIKDYSNINRIYVWISFVEIYNEKITDLLSIQKGTIHPLKIFSNNGNAYISGAKWLFASKIEDAFEILRFGLNKVSYASTGINDHSSRSHTIFTINLISEQDSEYQFSSFKFCDLAGAERVKKTGNVGDRLKEAGGINTSLLVLGRCLEALQQNQTKTNKKLPDVIIPVRDSKLTLLLQSSLLGHEKFVMIVNLYPTQDFFEENMNVLKFGSIANQIIIRKSEARKFSRSSRYSFMASTKLNNSIQNFTIDETIDEINESELDDSFKWNNMNNEQLTGELRKQKQEINVLKQIYIDREREFENQQKEYREKTVEARIEVREKFNKRNDENEKMIKELYERKMESMQIKYDRMLNEAYREIDQLERKLRKITKSKENKEESNSEESENDDLIELE